MTNGQHVGALRSLTDVASFQVLVREECATAVFGFGLALLVGLTVLLVRRLQWSRN